jgi:hypothetical protein
MFLQQPEVLHVLMMRQLMGTLLRNRKRSVSNQDLLQPMNTVMQVLYSDMAQPQVMRLLC